MDLIDEPRMAELYASMGPATEVSGGSAANTIAGIASLGGRAHYIGRVRDDQLGGVFAPRHPVDRRRLHERARPATARRPVAV